MITPFIGFAGNIGSGKTTFTRFISKSQNWIPFYEPVSDNPYLEDFYLTYLLTSQKRGHINCLPSKPIQTR